MGHKNSGISFSLLGDNAYLYDLKGKLDKENEQIE